MPISAHPAAYRLWRALRLSRGGRSLARVRANRLTPRRLARHAAAARAAADPSYAGEWAHLSTLLQQLGLDADGFAVDLAAGDGVTGSCTLPLFRDRAWRGLAIECDPARHALLAHAYAHLPRVALLHRRVTPASAVELLRAAGVPHGFTLLNLDIDSFDLEVAGAILPAFRPLVVDLEINEKIPPPVRFAVRYTPDFRWDEGHCYGCSLSAATDVMTAFGYRLEGLEYNNAFFVRNDLAARCGIEPLAPDAAYRTGYLERADRSRLFPWNADMEELLALEPPAVVARLREIFPRTRASYVLQLPPLKTDWAGGEDEAIRARFAWARRQGHPAWLWPEVSVAAWRDALGSIERVTRANLAGRSDVVLEGEPTALGIAAYTSGMGPLLGHWIESGEIGAGSEAGELLRLHLRHNRERMARLTEAAVGVVGRLADAGLTAMVLKGMHTAHAFFPDAAVRPLSDIDLHVSPAETAASEEVLREAGYRPVLVQRNPYKCDWAPAGAERGPRSLSFTHTDDPFTLDVHASLDRNFFGVSSVRLDRLLSATRCDRWGPAPTARVPGQPLLLLLLATHASEGLHGLSLIRLVELASVIRRDAERTALDWDEVTDAAAEVGALRFAYPALHLCEQLVPGSVPAAALGRFAAAATPAMRRVLAGLTPGSAQRLDRLSVEERFMWAGSIGERSRRLAYALWPAPAGGSLTELARIYGRRAWRLANGRVER